MHAFAGTSETKYLRHQAQGYLPHVVVFDHTHPDYLVPNNLEGSRMILLVLVLESNFFFTWVIPIAYVCECACAYVVCENQALVKVHIEIYKMLEKRTDNFCRIYTFYSELNLRKAFKFLR